MRIVIATAGSRGDLQPYVALGCGLRSRGHDVIVTTHRPYESFVRANGLGFRPLAGDPQALLTSEGGQAWLETGRDPLAFLLRCAELATPLIEPMMNDLREAVHDADAVLYGPLTYPAYDFAEARRVPAMMAGPVPLSPTSAFPFVVAPEWLPFGPLNYLTHQALLHLGSLGFMRTLNRYRREVGLPAELFGGLSLSRQRKMAALYGFSELVVPKPADWGPHLHVTGYWFLDAQPDWQPSPELTAFLDAGDPPVYVGFGSMVGRDSMQLASTVFTALERAGQRGIVLSGWAGLGRGDAPPHVLVVEDVPHAWLFPRMAAVVHHGGAGTTAAGLRAGVPSVVAPYFADQPFWASRVRALGVGPEPVPQVGLTAERLGRAIEVAVSDQGMRERAARLGEKIRAEDGVGRAIEVFEGFVGGAGGTLPFMGLSTV